MIFREDIEFWIGKRRRRADRERRRLAGERNVSDNSSVREERQAKKEKLLKQYKKESITTEKTLAEQKAKAVAEALYKQACLTGKNVSTVKRKEAEEEK